MLHGKLVHEASAVVPLRSHADQAAVSASRGDLDHGPIHTHAPICLLILMAELVFILSNPLHSSGTRSCREGRRW